MSSRIFIVALDASDPASDARHFRYAIKDNPDVISWWNYIPFVYLLASDEDADGLSASLHARSAVRRFLVVEVNLAESEGLLPEEAWGWIRRRAIQPGASKNDPDHVLVGASGGSVDP